MTLCCVDEYRSRRTVLVVVPTVEAGLRLMDAVPLLASDPRVTTFFTTEGPRATEFLRGLPTLPWAHAVRREFDLVLATDGRELAQLHGKTVVVPGDCVGVAPDVVAVAHEADIVAWGAAEPIVVGDLCYDRLMASIPFRAGYRRVFGVSRGQRLVVVESTLDVLDGLLAALPPERYRVAALLPPWLWERGAWQVHTWLAEYLLAGLLLPRPESWPAALLAADVVVGDRGPATRYGAAIGLPVLTAPSVVDGPVDGATELVHRHAPRLDAERLVPDQIEAVVRGDRTWQDGVAARVTARSGYAADLLRGAMYRMLNLPEPTHPVVCQRVATPRFSHYETVLPHLD